jgi:membrane-associated HD superfamily phosphohydrolase
MKVPEYKTQIYGGAILGLFSLILYFYIIPTEIVFTKRQMGVSPQYFPNLLAGLLFVLSIALIVDGYKNRRKKNQREYELIWKESRLVLITLGIIALQIVGFDLIGYLVPAMIAIAACMYIYGHRSHVTIVVVSILLPVSVKLFFEKALQVYLP